MTTAALAMSGPAQANPRPSNPQGATVSLAADSATAGGTLRYTGTGFVNEGGRGQIVTIKLDDVDILGTVTASDSGAISGTVTIPAATPPGSHWLRFLAGSGREDDGPARSLASSEFTVSAAAGGGADEPTAAPTGTPDLDALPKTGIDAGPWTLGAIMLPIAGFVLLLVDRRRRHRADAAS
ncbi:LPXTG cell wall anchor domain-containing protein [Micromonospora craniellae]|uniref:LPXTG cell wall anchor domain-containing protein n=1 Tax=Micromonospora craniellae TaxID=2294034 RepID=A0A372G6T4_9ACTN|nr:LPXTG cell wall anchor domain-containing protein [Micromonospora craniellae]QOC90126.1 LPXTG cell wall anchor domain-containing protein [Micromonospora craniellae]RFS48486.1 LPXTG cell wall anchor domain-containing protein [Micromonospora craniellae]